MADRTISVQLKADIAKYLADLHRAGKSTKSLGDTIDAAGKRSAQAFAALPAVAATAGAATAVALSGAATAFIGLGAVALRNNTEVRQSFEDLSHTINTGLAQDAAPLADAFVGAAADIGAAYTRLRPELQQAFEASVPYVEDLTAGVTGFAENAMPGVVDAVESAGPVFEGLRSLMEDTGTATGEFFSILSEHSAEAGAGVEHLGSLVSGVLPNIAELVGGLTDAWADHGGQVAEVVTQLTGVLADLSNSALPTLSDAVGVALDVLSGVLSVIQPIAGAIGPLIGLWLSLATAMKGMRAAKSALDVASVAGERFGRSMKTAGTRVKVGAALAVVGVAAIASALDDAFGGNQAPADIEAMAIGLERFAETSRLSGEAARILGGSTEELVGTFDDLTGMLGPITQFKESVASSLLGIQGSTIKAKKDIEALDKSLASLVSEGKGDVAAAVFNKMSVAAREAGYSTEELAAMLPKYAAAQEKANDTTKAASTAMFDAVPGADALIEAINTLGNKTATTADHVDALNEAWRQLFGIQIGLEKATSNWLGGLADLEAQIQGVKEGTNNWRNALITADGRIKLTTKAGRKLSESLIGQGEDYRTLAQTVYDTTLQRTGSEQKATAAVVAAASKRRAQFVDEMVQMGFTEQQAQDLANRYLGMPEDVKTLIAQPGMAAARSNARGYDAELDALDGRVISSYINLFKTITTTRDTRPDNSGGPPLPLPLTGATGGYVTDSGIIPGSPGGGMVRGPGGPTSDDVLSWLSNGEYVVNARATRENRELLQAINSGAFRGGPTFTAGTSGSAGGQNFYGDINVSAYSDRFSAKQVMDDLALHGVA